MVKTNPGTDTIEENIRATRQDIDDKVERIRERLSPGDLVDSVVHFARSNGGAIAGGVGRTLRDHPIPVAMIGAGVVWLALSSYYQSGDEDYEDEDAETTAHKLRERAAAVGKSARAGAAEVRDKAGRVGHRARVQAARATRSGGDFVREHPLLVGAAGIAAGVAIAAALPRTKSEDNVFGERAERVKKAAKSTAKKEGRAVREAAKSAVERAREVAAERTSGSGETPGDAKAQAGSASQRGVS